MGFDGKFSPRPAMDGVRALVSTGRPCAHGWVGLLWLGFATFATALAGEELVQPPESITAAIRHYIESNFRRSGDGYEIQVPALDTRLRLALCSKPIEAFSPPGARDIGHVSVGVRCTGDHPWTIYHRAYLGVFQDVAVLVTAAKAGTVLTEADVRAERRDVAALNGQYLLPETVIGRPLKKALPANTVLLPDFLTTIKAVKRGELVTIRNRSEAFEISMPGVALSDGEVGQRIRVRNEQSGRVIQATVTGSGMVDVNP